VNPIGSRRRRGSEGTVGNQRRRRRLGGSPTLLREAVEGGLDLGVGTVLPNPENLVGALPRELLVRRGCGARRPAAPGDRREGRLAAADAGKEESPELRRA